MEFILVRKKSWNSSYLLKSHGKVMEKSWKFILKFEWPPEITEDSTESATTFEAAAELISAHGSRLVATEMSQASQTTESRFKAITFKEGLKREGRPKKKSKQVKFSKIYLDRQLKKAKKSPSVSKASASETLSCPPVSVDNEPSEALLTTIQVNDILTFPHSPPRNYPSLNDEFPGASNSPSPYDVDHMHGYTSHYYPSTGSYHWPTNSSYTSYT